MTSGALLCRRTGGGRSILRRHASREGLARLKDNRRVGVIAKNLDLHILRADALHGLEGDRGVDTTLVDRFDFVGAFGIEDAPLDELNAESFSAGIVAAM